MSMLWRRIDLRGIFSLMIVLFSKEDSLKKSDKRFFQIFLGNYDEKYR